MFYDSSEACCASFFGDKECAVRDVCGDKIDIVTSVAPGSNGSLTTTNPSNNETRPGYETTLAPISNDNMTTEIPVSTTYYHEVTTPFVVTDPASTAGPLTTTETPICESAKWHISNDASHCTNR